MSESLLINLEAELTELIVIDAESISWLSLGESYLHVGNPDAGIALQYGGECQSVTHLR